MGQRGPEIYRVPDQVRDDRWKEDGLCWNTAPPGERETPFFPGGEGPEHYAEAKMICRACPVIDDCLEYAMQTKQPAGVWGGLTPAERIRLRKRRMSRRAA